MKRVILLTAVTCLMLLLGFRLVYRIDEKTEQSNFIRIGFIYENDTSTPYTDNFAMAQNALQRELQKKVEILTCSNALGSEVEEPLREMIRKGCRIIFTNTTSQVFREIASEYPEVDICQVAVEEAAVSGKPENYHTFSGRDYEGRYICGVVAGLKLREMISAGKLTPEQAVAGYVGAFPISEVNSGMTAFLLGIRSVVPQATLRVCYTGGWNNFNRERDCTKALIEEGCVVISQHTDTIGPAVACEQSGREVYHIGYNKNMMEVAPSTALVACRINWSPYIVGAVKAVMENRRIESVVSGKVHGNDICAGIDKGWVEVLELNLSVAAEGSKQRIDELTEGFRRGHIPVFKGNYTGVNPSDPSDRVDLSKEYVECRDSSLCTFCYLLDEIMTVENL